MEIEHIKPLMEESLVLPRYTKNFNNNGIWMTSVLSEDDEYDIRQLHRETEIKVFKECLKDAEEIVDNKRAKAQIIKVAVALYSARQTKIYTVINNKLDEMVRKRRV